LLQVQELEKGQDCVGREEAEDRVPAPESISPVPRLHGSLMFKCPPVPWQGWSGAMPRGRAWELQIPGGCLGRAGAAKGTCEGVGYTEQRAS
jgi:hypothetical protein